MVKYLIMGLGLAVFSYIVDHALEKIANRWIIESVFINPHTQTVYVEKERKGKRRYYINGIRVPCRVFDWCEDHDL